jgi:hypothetical protein
LERGYIGYAHIGNVACTVNGGTVSVSLSTCVVHVEQVGAKGKEVLRQCDALDGIATFAGGIQPSPACEPANARIIALYLLERPSRPRNEPHLAHTVTAD